MGVRSGSSRSIAAAYWIVVLFPLIRALVEVDDAGKLGLRRAGSILFAVWNKRTKRSEDRDEALQYLVEALADRSEVQAVVLVNDEGKIVAGMGGPAQVKGLAAMAIPMVRGEAAERFRRSPTRPISLGGTSR